MTAPADDDLLARYREACAFDPAAPDEGLRAAVLALAQVQAWHYAAMADETPTEGTPSAPASDPREAEHGEIGFAAEPLAPVAHPEAANDRHWFIPAVASVAVLGLAGLLALQFDRSPPDDQALGLGQRRAPEVANAMAPTSPGPTAAKPSATEAAAPAPSADVTPKPRPADAGQAHRDAESPVASSGAAPPPERPERRVPAARATRERADGTRATAQAPGREATEAPTAPHPAPSIDATPPAAARPPAPVAPAAQVEDMPSPEPPALPAHEAQPPAPAASPSIPPRPGERANRGAMGAQHMESMAPGAAAPALAPQADVDTSVPTDRATAAPALTPQERLLAAATHGQTAAARRALDAGAPPNATDASGRTALMLAAGRGDVTLVRMLLAAGADARRADHDGLTAAAHARRGGHEVLAGELDQALGSRP